LQCGHARHPVVILAGPDPRKEPTLSFFDEGDEPRTRVFDEHDEPRPRAPRPRGGGRRPPGRIDEQTLLVRRAVAGVVALVVVVLIVLGIRSCVNSQHQDSLRSYNTNVSSIVQASDGQVGTPFFQYLSQAGGKSPLDVEVQINQYRATAEQQLKQAQGHDVPGEMAGAQQNLVLALQFRAEGLAKIADQIRSALGGTNAQAAISVIAGEMRLFLASDVIYGQRVVPLISQVLADNHIGGQTIASSQFLPDIGWLSPQVVSSRLTGQAGTSGGPVRPGVHGHRLLSVSVNGQTLAPSPTVNHLTYSPSIAFDLKVANVGTNTEFGVQTSITISGGSSPITDTKTIDQTKAGTVTDVLIPLTQTPPIGTPVTLTAMIAGVPGEKVLTHNKLTFTVIFSH
jgi:hypothetical protein